MATILKLTGTCNWARLQKPDEKYNKYSLDFYPDKNSEEIIVAAKTQLKRRVSEEGAVFYKLGRPHTKLFRGDSVILGPPKVTDNEGKPYTGNIGNGSVVGVVMEVYPSANGNGTRLNEVRILELVEYNPTTEIASYNFPPTGEELTSTYVE